MILPFAIHWHKQHPQDPCTETGMNLSMRRNILAIVPATPSTLDGLCGAEQRNGVNSIFR